MCTTPGQRTLEGGEVVQIACRKCNQCLSARRNDWVARAMAEKAYMKHAFLLTLTYRNNEDGTKPDGAVTFVYRQVQLFLKRVRDAYFKKYGATGEISYIIAGERGSQKDRVHWHMVLFSKRPIDMLGEWTDKDQKPIRDWLGNVVNRPIIGKKKRCHWSYWEHGHVNVLRPDRKGMAYVVKYCLKDSFNVVNSKGTAREGKSENHGASYFRMSKKPPIGQRYLEQKIESWAERMVVPPELKITIPDYRGGYWYPKGKLRELLLVGLCGVNAHVNETTGKDAAGWRALLASVSHEKQLKDYEGLIYGQTEQEKIDLFEFIGPPEKSEVSWKERQERYNQWRFKQRAKAYEYEGRRRKCSGPSVCNKCFARLSAEEKAALAEYRAERYQKYIYINFPDWGTPTFRAWVESKDVVNPFCRKRGEYEKVRGTVHLQASSRSRKGKEG